VAGPVAGLAREWRSPWEPSADPRKIRSGIAADTGKLKKRKLLSARRRF
jgi:hypothetical protein